MLNDVVSRYLNPNNIHNHYQEEKYSLYTFNNNKKDRQWKDLKMWFVFNFIEQNLRYTRELQYL